MNVIRVNDGRPASCARCSHRPVCSVRQTIARGIIRAWALSDEAREAMLSDLDEQIAPNCGHYEPKEPT